MSAAKVAANSDVSVALAALEPPRLDQYCVAFGPGARQFCATPNGYSATQLPLSVMEDLLGGEIKKVLRASFGSEVHSYFFTYEMGDGTIAHRAGADIPVILKSFVEGIPTTSKCRTSLRVALGANQSFVAWSGSLWTSSGIPDELFVTLHSLSSTKFKATVKSYGNLKLGALEEIGWHGNGSWHVKIEDLQLQTFTNRSVWKAWKDLWSDELSQEWFGPHAITGQAYVAINPHSPTGGSFAFFKKAGDGREPEFILRFEPENVVARLNGKQVPLSDDGQNLYGQVTNVGKSDDEQQPFRWAVSKHSGRPHIRDSWELELKKGERLKILKHMGKDWFIVENKGKEKGWAHRAWLDFQTMRKHIDRREAYARFTVDIEKLLKGGNICSFPDLSRYVDTCVKDACRPLKKDVDCLGICLHDLHELMQGSDNYNLETLKMERNKWHPDKFARFCHPDHREASREKAQAFFVLFGVLMDTLENPRASEPTS